LAWVAGYVMRQFTCPKAVTHPSTNWAQCRATALIETNALPLHQTTNLVCKTHGIWDIQLQKCCYLANQVRGPSRSLEMSPCDRAHRTSYWRSIVTMALSRVVSEIFNVEWEKRSERRKHCVLPMQAGSILHLCTKFEADSSIRSTVIRGQKFRNWSRNPGHSHLEVVLYSLCRRGQSSISVPNLKRIAQFAQMLLRGSRN